MTTVETPSLVKGDRVHVIGGTATVATRYRTTGTSYFVKLTHDATGAVLRVNVDQAEVWPLLNR